MTTSTIGYARCKECGHKVAVEKIEESGITRLIPHSFDGKRITGWSTKVSCLGGTVRVKVKEKT